MFEHGLVARINLIAQELLAMESLGLVHTERYKKHKAELLKVINSLRRLRGQDPVQNE